MLTSHSAKETKAFMRFLAKSRRVVCLIAITWSYTTTRPSSLVYQVTHFLTRITNSTLRKNNNSHNIILLSVQNKKLLNQSRILKSSKTHVCTYIIHIKAYIFCKEDKTSYHWRSACREGNSHCADWDVNPMANGHHELNPIIGETIPQKGWLCACHNGYKLVIGVQDWAWSWHTRDMPEAP